MSSDQIGSNSLPKWLEKQKLPSTSQAFKNEYPSAEIAGHSIPLCYQGSSTPLPVPKNVFMGPFAEKNGVFWRARSHPSKKISFVHTKARDAPATLLL
jgi:hypothetical protein